MNLLFCGDTRFTGKVLSKEQSEYALSEVLTYAEKADFVIVNCETVLADTETCQPIVKAGPNLIDAPENIVFFDTLKTDVAILANNHMGDYGEKGLLDTIELFKQHNIETIGAGSNIEEAYKACYLEKDGRKLSLMAVCENEFGIATKTDYGAAGFKIGLLHNRIKEEKEKADFVVVIFHGGNEWNPMPTPKTVERYRLLCDIGADAVISMHTHCPQGYEIYKNKPIVYSLGNFFFEPGPEGKKDPESAWFFGYMASLQISEAGVSVEPVPYRFDTEGTKITVFNGENKKKMLGYIDKLSEQIRDEETVRDYFTGWVYRYPWTPKQVSNINSCLDTEHPYTGDYDLLSCEGHNEKLTEVYRIMMTRDIEKAKYWAEKGKELENMPVLE